MIRTSGLLCFSARTGEWSFSAAPDATVITCDHTGCAASVRPTGLERNGARVDSIYGCGDWSLRERDLCPEHKPPSFWCPQCGARSYNPNDIEQRYCGNCRMSDESRRAGDRG